MDPGERAGIPRPGPLHGNGFLPFYSSHRVTANGVRQGPTTASATGAGEAQSPHANPSVSPWCVDHVEGQVPVT